MGRAHALVHGAVGAGRIEADGADRLPSRPGDRAAEPSRFAEASDRAPIPPFADMYIDHKAPPVKDLRARRVDGELHL